MKRQTLNNIIFNKLFPSPHRGSPMVALSLYPSVWAACGCQPHYRTVIAYLCSALYLSRRQPPAAAGCTVHHTAPVKPVLAHLALFPTPPSPVDLTHRRTIWRGSSLHRFFNLPQSPSISLLLFALLMHLHLYLCLCLSLLITHPLFLSLTVTESLPFSPLLFSSPQSLSFFPFLSLSLSLSLFLFSSLSIPLFFSLCVCVCVCVCVTARLCVHYIKLTLNNI